jgi:ABC-type uncharacterized transport system substrate-binding protein
MRFKNVIVGLVLCATPYITVPAEDSPANNVLSSIKALKIQNFFIQKLGVLVAGELSASEIQALENIQKDEPRQMRIFVTQSDLVSDVFKDFTFLARAQKVDAILVWPNEVWRQESFQTKICQMSMRTKVPVIALQPGWVDKGAILEFDYGLSGANLITNEKVCSIFNYSTNPVKGFMLLAR